MQGKKKKQFSLSLLARVFLVILVVSSVGIFANSVMKYNEQREEQKRLEEKLRTLEETREELQTLLSSSEKVERILAIYKRCTEIETLGAISDNEDEYEELKAELTALLENEQNRNYIIRIAKDKLGLYFPDEIIFYNDRND